MGDKSPRSKQKDQKQKAAVKTSKQKPAAAPVAAAAKK
jgi:hypothetical protein